MSRYKQIEEMAKDLAKIQCNKKGCEDCEFYQFECDDLQHYTKIAELLNAEGYRKASEVAEEIFAETHNMLVKVMRAVDDELTKAILTDNEQAKLVYAGTKETLRCVILALAELKKKYIGKDINVTTNAESEKDNGN